MSRCVTLGASLLRAGRRALADEAGARRVVAALAGRSARPRALLAIGKAAWAMAQGAIEALGPIEGLVVCKEPPPIGLPPCLRVLIGGHPQPDERSVLATQAALSLAHGCSADEELLVLISGGTSALVGGPIEGVGLDALARATDQLLRAGFPISTINVVRRRLGAALGGRLAAATRARVTALVISDVAGDDLRVIGSGPASAPPLDDAERAVRVARDAGLDDVLITAVAHAAPTPAALHAALAERVHAEILASPSSLAASAARALALEGLHVRTAADLADGSVEALAARLTDELAALSPGEAYLIVGEPTVRVTGQGLGGRAQHLALSMLRALAGYDDRAVLALASDGSDGPTDAAGALLTSETARTATIDVDAALAAHDSHHALEALQALVRTGPTGTNLTDLYVLARAH